MVDGRSLGRRCILTYQERLENARLEAGKQRLKDEGCQVSQMHEFAE